MWSTNESYLQWLQQAYEHLKNSKYVYDRRRKRIFYNKQYWLHRFKVEIQRVEHMMEAEVRLEKEIGDVA
jgi:hypothetical protein